MTTIEDVERLEAERAAAAPPMFPCDCCGERRPAWLLMRTVHDLSADFELPPQRIERRVVHCRDRNGCLDLAEDVDNWRVGCLDWGDEPDAAYGIVEGATE